MIVGKQELEKLVSNLKRNGIEQEVMFDDVLTNSTGEQAISWGDQWVQFIGEKKKEAKVSQGKCSICGKQGKLYSDTCEECFGEWMRPFFNKMKRPPGQFHKVQVKKRP